MADLGGIELSKILVIDTETTGVKPGNDEVLSLSAVDGRGVVLFDDFIRPARRKRWPKAAEINGITWGDVKDKKTLVERKGEIMPLFENADVVVGYNVDFDLKMLEASGLAFGSINTFDVMKEYARLLPGGRYVKLTDCANRYGYTFAPHESLSDVLATLHCYKALLNDDEYLRIREFDKRLAEAASSNPATLEGDPGQYRNSGSVIWLVLAVLAFVMAAILGICLNTAVTTIGTIRGIFWTTLFLVLGVFFIVKWRKK